MLPQFNFISSRRTVQVGKTGNVQIRHVHKAGTVPEGLWRRGIILFLEYQSVSTVTTVLVWILYMYLWWEECCQVRQTWWWSRQCPKPRSCLYDATGRCNTCNRPHSLGRSNSKRKIIKICGACYSFSFIFIIFMGYTADVLYEIYVLLIKQY
jgi:hypothetical protein